MSRRNIEIGKEAFENVLEYGSYKEPLLEICNKYSIQYKILKDYIHLYITRVVSPKPTEDQMQRFEIIKRGGKSFIENRTNNSANIQIRGPKFINSRNKIKEIIERYYASNEVYPDSFIRNYYNTNDNGLTFFKTLLSYSNDSEEAKKESDNFIIEMNHRINEFIKSITKLLDLYPIEDITAFDMELATGLNSNSLYIALSKRDAMDSFGRNTVSRLINKVKNIPKSVKKYSLEEALNIKISINGKEATTDDIKTIYQFLIDNKLDTSYNNLTYAYQRYVPTSEELIGKEAYDSFISNSGNTHVLGEISKKYNISLKETHKYISRYRKRLFNPKPNLEEDKAFRFYTHDEINNFINLDRIIEELIFAKNDKDLESVIKKYEFVSIKKAVNEYLISKDNYDDDKKELKDKFDKLCEIINLSQMPKKKDDKFLNILNDYLDDSDAVYPDLIATMYGTNGKNFEKRLYIYKEKGIYPEEVNAYIKEKNTRVARYVERLKSLLEEKELLSINPLDIELALHMDMRNVIMSLMKKDTMMVMNKLSAMNLINNLRILAGSNRILSLDEANNIDYLYKNRKINEDDIIMIYSFLKENNLPATHSNIIYGFERLVDGSPMTPGVNRI